MKSYMRYMLSKFAFILSQKLKMTEKDQILKKKRTKSPFYTGDSVTWRVGDQCGHIRDVAKVFNRRKSSNDRRAFGLKAHSSVPLARYT